ncbi:MAG: type II secretion system protein M [Halieaceae bacterium]
MLEWFWKHSQREQVYLLAAAIVVVLYLLLMGIWRPVSGMRDEMVQRNTQISEKLVRVRAMASELGQLQSGAAPRTVNMNQLINSSTAELGIRPTRIQPNSRGETQIRFENVSFNQLLRWLHRMEYIEGIAVREAAINQGDRGGLVKATIRIGQGG